MAAAGMAKATATANSNIHSKRKRQGKAGRQHVSLAVRLCCTAAVSQHGINSSSTIRNIAPVAFP